MKLITLSGDSARLRNPIELSDFDAGFLLLNYMANNSPLMGKKWYEKAWSGITDTVGGAANWIADTTGSAVRLLTDEEVLNGLSRAGMAYASGGQSEAARSLLSQFGLSSADVSKLGQQGKLAYASVGGGFGDIPKEYLLIGGGVLALVAILAVLK